MRVQRALSHEHPAYEALDATRLQGHEQIRGLKPAKPRCVVCDEVKKNLIAAYRDTRCDILASGEWSPLAVVPHGMVFLMTAANPGGSPGTVEENVQADSRLLRTLLARHLQPTRMRGRSPSSLEEGWMIPHLHERSLELLRTFRQNAGIVMRPDGRSILWADGSETPLDDTTCEVPTVPSQPEEPPSVRTPTDPEPAT